MSLSFEPGHAYTDDDGSKQTCSATHPCGLCGQVKLVDVLRDVLNRHSAENPSNTPDFILAQYLLGCLAAWNTAVQQRETWYGRDARHSVGMLSNLMTERAKPESCALVGCDADGPHAHDDGGPAKAAF